jgi:hypothetical protein
MDYLFILAKAAEKAAETTGSKAEAAREGFVPIDLIWQHITSLGLIEALTFIAFGTVCLFYGWRVFKILVTISFGLLGLLVAVWANEYIQGKVVWLALVSIVIFAALSIPLMKYGVMILGAAAGGIITSGGWLAAGLPERYIWAGALVGIIGGAMISFIVFKIAVMLFTSLGGSSLMVVGFLAILYQNMGDTKKLQEMVFEKKWFLPLMLVVPMVAGMILQYKFIKGTKDWDI